jgi:uncharacterized membrane protein YedE/YeeE
VNPSAAAVALAGGALIGAGASLLLFLTGRLAALSGIVSGLLRKSSEEWGWRAAFVAGLLGGGILCAWIHPSVFARSPASAPVALLTGVAVGFGARLGGGCTSGHGICGISRLSKRSFVATLTFMFMGALVVMADRILRGTP